MEAPPTLSVPFPRRTPGTRPSARPRLSTAPPIATRGSTTKLVLLETQPARFSLFSFATYTCHQTTGWLSVSSHTSTGQFTLTSVGSWRYPGTSYVPKHQACVTVAPTLSVWGLRGQSLSGWDHGPGQSGCGPTKPGLPHGQPSGRPVGSNHRPVLLEISLLLLAPATSTHTSRPCWERT